MLYSVVFFGAFAVVEPVKSADKVACDTSYSVESNGTSVMFTSAAAGAYIAYYACISAAGVTVNGVIYSTVAYA